MILFSFIFTLPSGAATFEKLRDEDNNSGDYDKESSHDVQEEVLEPVEVVSVRLHVGVVRMSEQILQPPHRPVQGVERLVKDQSAQLGDRALVRGVGQHLQLNISYKYFEIFVMSHYNDSLH